MHSCRIFFNKSPLRFFSLSHVAFKLALFEVHLRKQAIELGISPRQPPPILREMIKAETKKVFDRLGIATEGLPPSELRKRLRTVYLLDTAKELVQKGNLQQIDSNASMEEIKALVFNYYQTELRKLNLPTKGSLPSLKTRLSAKQLRE